MVEEVIYFSILAKIPEGSISRMVNNLDIADDVLMLDLIRYLMDPNDHPFIVAVSEIPVHLLVEGVDYVSQMDGLVYTLVTWVNNTDFSELKEVLHQVRDHHLKLGYKINPVRARDVNNFIEIEFGHEPIEEGI